jgi:2-polyprenyl-3-methyl-5-hydroxy-6-metoxy-1,4-benzoquinol methylase
VICPACRAAGSRPHARIREFEFRRCRSCATLFCTNEGLEEHAAGLYGDRRYYENPEFGLPEVGGYNGYRQYLADRRHIEAKFDEILHRLEQLRPPGRLLDVGAGPGFLISAARPRGWDAVGVDLNRWAADYAREFGLDVRATSLTDAGFDDAAFDAVTMMDVIEHVSDVDGLVAEAARVTRPGGTLALLTPDAGSPVSRALGGRWSELQRVPEHVTLLSVRGATSLLERHGYEVIGWHWIGKRSDVSTLLADVYPTAPAIVGPLQAGLEGRPVMDRVITADPRTKFCLYARRLRVPVGRIGAPSAPRRLRRERLTHRPADAPSVEQAIFEDLSALARARRLCDWMFEQYADAAAGRVAEVGAGLGTFSQRLLDRGARELLLVEPETACADVLRERFGSDGRVTVANDTLPGSPALAAQPGAFDLVVCQNVLEHIEDDAAATAAMAGALCPGGRLTMLVPAHPRLFGTLDETYGHHRRYTHERLRGVVEEAGLTVVDLYAFNLLGIPGWWWKSRRAASAIGGGSLAVYEALLALWRPVERRWRPPVGLSAVVHAQRPQDG